MPRETLTREAIVRAAVEVLDAEGVSGLNMRRLGAFLGVAPGAVYRHISNRDELVVLAADRVWLDIELPDSSRAHWQESAKQLARGAHGMILRHFWLMSVMTTHLIFGPGKARYDESCLTVFETGGFDDAEADRASATMLMFVIGAAQGEAAESAWRARVRRSGADVDTELRATAARIGAIARQFPRLGARAQTLGPEPEIDDFEYGLQTVMDGLQARLNH